MLRLLFETFHLYGTVLRFPGNNLFSDCIVWTDHTLHTMQKIISWLCHVNDRYFSWWKRKSIFHCFGSNQLFGKFHTNFPFNNYVAFNYTSNIQFPICCPTVA